MNTPSPDNSALDALFLRAGKHPEVRADLFVAMLEAELYTLVPRGDMQGSAEEEARPLSFIRWAREGREYHFVYTSARMARKAQESFKGTPSGPMTVIGMPGRELLQLMSVGGVGIALNAGTETFELMFNDKVLEDMLDGSFFEPHAAAPGDRMHGRAKAVLPEHYPLSLVQPVFDFLKTRPEVQAAWVLQYLDATKEGEMFYIFALLTTTDDDELLHADVGRVLTMVNHNDRRNMSFGVTSMDYSDPSHVDIMRKFVPFYAAPGYNVTGITGKH